MRTKTRQIISGILMAIPALVLITGGILKLAGAEPEAVVRFLTRAGYGDHIHALGLAGLIIAALLLYPKTNKIGFLLASCYLAGALSIELSAGQPPFSAVFIALLWMGMFLKNKDMFLGPSTNNKIQGAR